MTEDVGVEVRRRPSQVAPVTVESGLHPYDPVSSLLNKFEGWLRQQPEWAIILTQPRATRRQAAHALMKLLLTIPPR